MLRRLKQDDAKYMYEWMTASDVNKYFRFDPSKISIESCEKFIKDSFNKTDRTYAIDVNGEYAGSISLKHIDMNDKNAEFAISIRKKYRGKGLGKQAIKDILEIAFYELKLNKVYLNVLSDNVNAIKAYEKSGFIFEGELVNHIRIDNEYKNLKLYGIWRSNYEEMYKRNWFTV